MYFRSFATVRGNRGKGRPRINFKCKCGEPATRRGLCKRCYRQEPDQVEATKRQHRAYYLAHREQLVEYQRRLRAENPEAMRAYWRHRRAEQKKIRDAMGAVWVCVPGWGVRV